MTKTKKQKVYVKKFDPPKPNGWLNSPEGSDFLIKRAERFAWATTTPGPGKSDSYPSKKLEK